MCLGVGRGDPERGLSGVADALGDSGQKQRPAGDHLQVLLRLGQPREQVPPIVDEGHEAGGEPATGEVVGGGARRPPLVLQLVEDILAIGAVAIELAETEDAFAERGDESGMLPDLAVISDGGKR